jgi:hypothetical protein
MANPKIPTNGTHELQERYASSIVKIARKNLVTNEEDIFSTDYEGDPKAGAVKVPVRNTEVVVGDYDVVAGGALGTSATVYLTITIGNNKFVNELIDGFEAAAVPDNLIAQRIDSAGYSIGLVIDDDAMAVIDAGGTTSSNTTVSSTSTAYSNWLAEQQALNIADIPLTNRYGIVSPAYFTLIKQDSNFVSAGADTGFNEVKKAGMVGMIDGVPVFMSNNMAADVEFVIGHKAWTQRIMEWFIPPMIKDLPSPHIGASALQGRWIFEHVITLATAIRIKTFA